MQSGIPNTLSPLRRLWWLEPSWLFALVVGGTMAVAASQSKQAFGLYGAPKYITEWHVLLTLVAILVFVVGRGLGGATGRAERPVPSRIDGLIDRAFWVLTGLAIFGYAIWLAVGLKNGFTLGTLLEFLATDNPLMGEHIRDDMFYTVPGITTCAQFGVAAVPLGLWLTFRGRPRIWPVVLLILLAAVRALVFSERLAVVELVVPGFVIFLRMAVLGRPLATTWRWILKGLPPAGLMAMLLFFGTFEYFRSWRFYHHEFDSYPQFVLWRVTGYYTIAHNNSAMALETQPRFPLPYSTLQMFWRAPGLSKTPLGYERLTGIDPAERFKAMLERYGTPELNNEGGLFQPALDYGLAGFALFWFAFGVVCGRLYRAYLVGSFAGVMLYPLIFIAILETPRLLYLCYTRSLPALVALACVTILTYRAPRRSLAALPIPATA